MKTKQEEETEPFIVTANEAGASGDTQSGSDEIIKTKPVKRSLRSYLANIIAFLLLTAQTALVVLTMRYSRLVHSDVSDEPAFAITVAVMFAEIGKCLVGIVVTLFDLDRANDTQKGASHSLFRSLFNEVFNDSRTVMKMSVPAILYAIQNNLLFTALSNLDSAFYQILYQLKTFTAAILAVLMLGRVYTKYQWLSFVCLAGGAVLANMSVVGGDPSVGEDATPVLGVMCVLCATLTSGFCGVFMEKQLKSSKQSLYIKNIQLGMFGALGCMANSYFNGDLQNIIIPYGLMHGFSNVTWFVVFLNIVGGYLVAWIIKYVENIAKAFASTTALILIVGASYFFFGTQLSSLFFVGLTLVLLGNMLFNHKVLCE